MRKYSSGVLEGKANIIFMTDCHSELDVFEAAIFFHDLIRLHILGKYANRIKNKEQ